MGKSVVATVAFSAAERLALTLMPVARAVNARRGQDHCPGE